jgi:PucR family transcriptional regulator, purine catabolism regulatory protein
VTAKRKLPRMLPTVDEVLALPAVRRGRPRVLAGHDALGARVRWVHVSELPDIAYLLRGGELILTTGIGLPRDPDELRRYVDDLSAATASGVVVELGRAFADLPDAMVRQAQRRGLPLVVLDHEVRYVEVTEVVHGMIVDAQVDALRTSESIHRRFTELSVEGAQTAEVVEQAARLTGVPVVLENLTHQVLAVAGAGRDLDVVLADWEARSRARPSRARTAVVGEPEPWLVTTVAARGEGWGRLVAILDTGAEAASHQPVVVERAAAAIALNRLVERDRETLERQSHRSLLSAIRSGGYTSTAEAGVRAEALGVPLSDRSLVALVVRVRRDEAATTLEAEAQVRDDAELVAAAVREAGVPALVGAVADRDTGALLTLPADPAGQARADTLAAVGAAIHRHFARLGPTPAVTVGAGSTVETVRHARRSFLEAEQVVDAVGWTDGGKLVFELPDIRIRGLLHILRDDPRLQTFVERELGALLAYDDRHGSGLVDVLSAYLRQGRNKSAAADALGISRPAFYHRLARVGRVLDIDLDDVDSCLSLHVALLGLEAARDTTGQ